MQQQGRCLQLRQLLSITMDEVQVFVLTLPLSTCRAESGEVSGRGSEVCVQPEGVVCGARHHAHPLVLAHTLLKEVGLSLQRDVLHEVEGVLHPVDLQTHRPQVRTS